VDHASPDESKLSLGLTPPQMAQRILERFATDLGVSIPSTTATKEAAVPI
jgi:1-deoxy-D-xylulose-5-phosphate synthase